ncbi:MAG: DUF6252 family protein [Bacteroidota bacterium]
MKTRNLIVMMLLVFSVVMSSCKKDDDSDDPVTGNGTMSLVYGGTSWNASLAVQAINTNGVINITGSDSEARQASVILMGVTEAGTYQISTGSTSQLRWTEGLGQEQTYVANGILGSGTVTISELSATKIVGTFNFTGYNTNGETKEITDGQFSADF